MLRGEFDRFEISRLLLYNTPASTIPEADEFGLSRGEITTFEIVMHLDSNWILTIPY